MAYATFRDRPPRTNAPMQPTKGVKMDNKLDIIYDFIFKETAPDDWSDNLKLLIINFYLEAEIKIEQELEKTRSELWKTNAFNN